MVLYVWSSVHVSSLLPMTHCHAGAIAGLLRRDPILPARKKEMLRLKQYLLAPDAAGLGTLPSGRSEREGEPKRMKATETDGR
jgi:hypothetical protein